MATSVEVRGVNCVDSLYNQGSFGAQYDAQVSNIELVSGRKGTGGTAGPFNEDSRMAIFGVGPYSGGGVMSFSLWINTHESNSEMILVHYGLSWQNTELSNAQNKCDGCESEVIGLKAKLGQKTKDYIDVQYSASFAIKKSEQLAKELGEATKKLEKQASACEELSQQTLQLTATLEAQKNKMESINKDFKRLERSETRSCSTKYNRIHPKSLI